eukprot:7549548-Alexandrium_andersonii.AAC.1
MRASTSGTGPSCHGHLRRGVCAWQGFLSKGSPHGHPPTVPCESVVAPWHCRSSSPWCLSLPLPV